MNIRTKYLSKKYELMYNTFLYINKNNAKTKEYKAQGFALLKDKVESLPDDIAFRPRPWRASFCIKMMDKIYVFISKNNLYKPLEKKFDALFHEIGHWLHFQNKLPTEDAEKIWANVNKDMIKQKVSKHALKSKDGSEFVAEVFKYRIKGKTFDEEIMSIYDALKGPKLRGDKQ